MAIVTKIEKIPVGRDAKHSRVNCTYYIITDASGKKYLQIDSYGSASRQFKGKKSQSLRFDSKTAKQLMRIINTEF